MHHDDRRMGPAPARRGGSSGPRRRWTARQPASDRFSRLGPGARGAHLRQGAARCLGARFLQRLRPHGARPAGAPVAGDPADARRGGRQARLLLLIGVPDGAESRFVPDEHGPLRGGGGGGRRLRLRARACARVRGRSGPRQRRARAAGRLLHGLAGDAGAAGHRLRHSLRLRNVRAEDRRRPPGRAARQLAAARQHLGAAAPRGRADRPLRRRGRLLPGQGRPHPRQLGEYARGDRPALRFVHRRPPDRHGEHAAALGGARDARLRPAVLQRGRLPARGRGEDRYREHLQGALSQRSERGGQGAAPQAAVLLRRLLDRRHRPALQDAPHHVRRLPREVRDPAERHPPVHRRRRAHAGSARRRGPRLGHGLDDHGKDDWLHQPHALARGAGALAGGAVRAPLAAAPADHLRDQPPILARGADPLAGRQRPARADVDHRRARRQAGAHGPPGDGRLPQRQRRGQASLGSGQGGAAPRLLRALAGEVQQQDQRRHAAALDPAREPAAHAARDPPARLGVDRLPSSAPGGADLARRRRGRPRRAPRRQAAEQARRRRARRGARRRAATRGDVRRSGQAHPRVQAAAPRLPADRRRTTSRSSATPTAATCRAPTSSPARPRPAT